MLGCRLMLSLMLFALVMPACGGKAAQDPLDRSGTANAGSGGNVAPIGGSSGGPGAEAGAPDCADTPRQPSDEELNAVTLEVAAHAAPDTPIPLFITLTEVAGAEGAPLAEKQRLYAPSQSATEARLNELGATSIERFSLSNLIRATVSARHVPLILCWPNVLHLETDAPYWSVVDPPWGPDEAGPEQCPLQPDGHCPTHCLDIYGTPRIASGGDGSGCFVGRAVAACGRAQPGIDDLPYACRHQLSTRRDFLFTVPPPTAPGFVDWVACEHPEPVLCDTEG